jgi:hypothetical protein
MAETNTVVADPARPAVQGPDEDSVFDGPDPLSLVQIFDELADLGLLPRGCR